jgi:hypothetical protein
MLYVLPAGALLCSISVRSNQVRIIQLQVVQVLPGRQHRPHHGPTNLGLSNLLIASLDDALVDGIIWLVNYIIGQINLIIDQAN